MSEQGPEIISSPIVRVTPADTPNPTEEREAVNPLLRLHTLLCGRYVYAVLLGLVMGICGAVAAWVFTPAKYEIVGYVRIRPYVPKVLYQSDENGVLPSFETFVDLQESLLQSQRVMDRAAESSEWKAIGRAPTTFGASGISVDDLVVDHPKGSELVTVTATDRDLNAAMAAVKSILQAYLEISGETDSEGDAHRLQLLEDLRVSLANQERAIHDQILTIANEYGTDDLSQQYAIKVDGVSKLETQLQQINLDLSIAQATRRQVASNDPLQATGEDVTPEAVATVDAQMRDYLAQQDAASLRLFQLQAKLGEENDEVKTAKRELSFVKNRIESLLNEYRARGGVTTAPSPSDREHSQMSPAELTAEQTNVRTLYDKARAEALDLGRKDLQLHGLKQDEAAIKQRLDEASNRIDQLNLEANSAERISILSYGERPTTPPKSKRMPATAGAGVGGIVTGVALVALWGLIEHKIRSVLQIQQLEPTVRVLGVLPVLPEGSADSEQESLAAHCIHHIRNVLDDGDRSKSHVLGITSPAAGDGKTSLSLALGLSFAAAGSRTLLVDCDMTGGGLTERLNATARPGIGIILLRNGLLTEAQLNEANKVAKSTSNKLVDVLFNLGYVTESDIRQAYSLQRESSVGLLNALDGDHITTCIAQVLTKNLFVLPRGKASSQHSSQISSKTLRRVVNQARGLFDVVIVDTGPILGSLEASIVVREVDQVVITVTRDGRASLVKSAIARLDSLGIRFCGLVFNRATPRDVATGYYRSSSGTTSSRPTRPPEGRDQKPHNGATHLLPRLGSLAAAVVSSSAMGSEKEADSDRLPK